MVDNATLVPNDLTNETHCSANNVQDRQMENGRMALIRSKRQMQGMTEDEIEFLEYSMRKNTRKVYNNGWKKWENWCKQQLPTVNPQAYDPDNVLNFLMNHRNYSSQHLNGLRSSIASVFRVLHPNETSLAQQEKIVQFFQAKRHQEVKTPTEADLSAWDTDIVVHYAKTNWRNNHQLTLFDLQKKTLIILCLATMARPRSDIGRLMYKNVQFTLQDNMPVSVLLFFPEAKETNMKTARFGLIDKVEVCLTRTLFHFIQRTQSYRQNLPEDHTLFLTYLDNKNKTSSSVRPSTVSSWVKQIMTEAGIDTTVYKAHSIRSASSTKAIELGYSQDKVEEHANWSKKANAFSKYYYKPIAQQCSSTKIAGSILSLTENHTTLTDGAESKEIVVGTTNNSTVDEAKSKNVVHPPWYKTFYEKYFN
ncbi:hypothetical protein G6F66_012208 [Rhizopus arrhizus]|nr:hypothetical protein G6F66_012208 [Rhizopus arrhizus]